MQSAILPPLGAEDADKALVQSQWLTQHGAAPGQPSTSAATAAAPPRSSRWPERAAKPQGPTQGPPAAAAVPPIAGTGEVSRFTSLLERLRARLLLGAGSSAIREASPPSFSPFFAYSHLYLARGSALSIAEVCRSNMRRFPRRRPRSAPVQRAVGNLVLYACEAPRPNVAGCVKKILVFFL